MENTAVGASQDEHTAMHPCGTSSRTAGSLMLLRQPDYPEATLLGLVYSPLCRGDKLALNTVADFIQVQSLRRSQDQVAVGSENSAAPKRRRLIRADEFR